MEFTDLQNSLYSLLCLFTPLGLKGHGSRLHMGIIIYQCPFFLHFTVHEYTNVHEFDISEKLMNPIQGPAPFASITISNLVSLVNIAAANNGRQQILSKGFSSASILQGLFVQYKSPLTLTFVGFNQEGSITADPREEILWSPTCTVVNPSFFSWKPCSGCLLNTCASHLLVGNRNKTLFGEFPQGVYVRSHVQLAAHQHHFGVGTELLSLALPLWRQDTQRCSVDSAAHLGSCVCCR